VFPGRYDNLIKIVDFVTTAAHAAGLDDRSVDAVQLAVDEACSNIIEHAYGGEERGEIRCDCQVAQGRLTVSLTDFGVPFDPTVVPEPNLCNDIERRTEGGLGLYLMRQLMDNVDFYFHPVHGNVLTMVKYVESTA
jgi:serine/threonine-protein kinase RsbW